MHGHIIHLENKYTVYEYAFIAVARVKTGFPNIGATRTMQKRWPSLSSALKYASGRSTISYLHIWISQYANYHSHHENFWADDEQKLEKVSLVQPQDDNSYHNGQS